MFNSLCKLLLVKPTQPLQWKDTVVSGMIQRLHVENDQVGIWLSSIQFVYDIQKVAGSE